MLDQPVTAIEGGIHRMPIRVYYEDTDAGGVVYHATYLRYAERARAEMLRAIGFPTSRLATEWGIAFAVRHCDIDFAAPARLDELLSVESRVLEVGGASLGIEQRVLREGRQLVRLTLKLVGIGPDFRAMRLPAELKAAILLHVHNSAPLKE